MQSNHETAEANMVVRLVKDPVKEWGAVPVVTAREERARELRTSGTRKADSCAASESASPCAPAANGDGSLPGGPTSRERGVKAPGHGAGVMSTGIGDAEELRASIWDTAYELD